MHSVRIYEMPDCRMVSSGSGMFGEERFEAFAGWMSKQTRGMFPRNFLMCDENSFNWLYMYEDGMDVPPEFDVIDFRGGLYAVVTDMDGDTDRERMIAEVDAFLDGNGFERDASRAELGNIITPPLARQAMGFDQMDYYTPIKLRRV